MSEDCVALLQWALPQLGLRWPGYRKVRRQVCRRVTRRARALGLDGLQAYRARLEADPEEWPVLDALTRITISRFYRDRDTFGYLCDTALPELRSVSSPHPIEVWSAGCGRGEEAYTLAIAAHVKQIPVRITATDVDAGQLERARRACFSPGCLKDLPAPWRAVAFEQQDDGLRLRDDFRRHVTFLRQDLRSEMPDGPFALVLCRYLAFTYFAEPLQRQVATRLLSRTLPGGFVALGKHETWPRSVPGVVETQRGLRVYRVDEGLDEPG